MFDKLLKLSLLTIFMVLGLLIPSNAIAETAKDEDMFDRPIAWGTDGWSVSKIINIQDSLVGSMLGKVVIDRHGEDPENVLFKSPFATP
jgi:hypothetical protein